MSSDVPPPSGAPGSRDHDTGVLEATSREDLERLDWELDPRPDPDHEGPAPMIVVFDIGEVLVDETRVWEIWADILGVSHLTFAAVLGAAIVQGEDHLAVFPHLAPNIEWDAFLDEHERRLGGLQEQDLYPDARPCLEELKAKGCTIGIAGNQPLRRREQLVAMDLPYDILATSEDFGFSKPEPGFFDSLLGELGVPDPADVLYVGDRVDNDVIPAAEHGLRTCWLRRGPWGQLQELPADMEADLVLEGLGELPLLLQQWRGEV